VRIFQPNFAIKAVLVIVHISHLQTIDAISNQDLKIVSLTCEELNMLHNEEVGMNKVQVCEMGSFLITQVIVNIDVYAFDIQIKL